nr:hypothetical protein [Tanacetum cinerariifolium]
MSSYNHFGCSWCGGPFNGGNCPGCSSVGSGNEFVYDPNPYSYNETPNFFIQPQQHQYDTYSCDLCGDSPQYGFDCQTRTPLAYEQEPCYNQNFSNNYYPQNSSSFPQQDLCCENYEGPHELAEYINTPGWNRPAFCNNDEDDNEDYIIAITPDFPITDSLIMENENLDTIPETKSDELIKSSVENLVPIPSESEDFSNVESECDMPDCDDSQTTNFSTFSNPLFDDSTSSDDESSHEEVIHEMSFKTYGNLLFDLDEDIISNEFNPIHNEDLDSIPKNDRFDTKSYLLESLLNRDESIPSGIDNDDSDSEGDNLFLERLLHDDPIPLPDTLDFSYE